MPALARVDRAAGCLPLKPIGSVSNHGIKEARAIARALFSAALLQCTAWIAFPRAPSSRQVEVTRPDVEPATGIINPGSAGGPHRARHLPQRREWLLRFGR